MNEGDNKIDILSEKSFTKKLVMLLIGIIICSFGLCTTTWAWYGNSVSSSSTTIKTASCVVIPTVETEGNEVFAQTDGSYLFLADVEYTVTITAEGTSSSAYCKLISDGAEYYTQQIDTVAPDDEISFKLKFTMDKTVFIDTRWGESSREERDIKDGELYVDFRQQ